MMVLNTAGTRTVGRRTLSWYKRSAGMELQYISVSYIGHRRCWKQLRLGWWSMQVGRPYTVRSVDCRSDLRLDSRSIDRRWQ